MSGPLSETLRIEGAEVAVLARNTKQSASDVKAIPTGAALTTVSKGFPGFTIGASCTKAGTAVSKAVQDLGKVLDNLGDNTVTVLATFLHIDEAQAREFDRLNSAGGR